MRIIDSRAIDIRLYPRTSFPVDVLRFEQVGAKLQADFGCENLYYRSEVHRTNQPVQFSLVEGLWNDIRISEIAIDGRKTVTRVLGSSDASDSVAKHLETVLGELRSVDAIQPVTCTNESILTVSMDIDFEALFDRRVVNVVREFSSELLFSETIEPQEISFLVDYATPSEMKAHGVTLSRKPIVLRREPGAENGQAVLISNMPARTELHAKILTKLESSLIQARS